MKKCILIAMLMAIFVPANSLGQEADGVSEQLQAAEKQLELRRIQLEFQEIEGKAAFRQQMRELELDERRIGLQHQRAKLKYSGYWKHRNKKCVVPFVILCLVVNILVAVWVYKDIQQRKTGSGVWIVIALLAGLLGVLVYAIVRVGDNRQT